MTLRSYSFADFVALHNNIVVVLFILYFQDFDITI